jgi:hypothetical protein
MLNRKNGRIPSHNPFNETTPSKQVGRKTVCCLTKKGGHKPLFLRFGDSKAAFYFKLQTAKHFIMSHGRFLIDELTL